MSARKILLVDDSKSARYALRLLLQKHNFDVDTADSAESALEKVTKNTPDAIFMDHLMPGMNGFEALERLKADTETAHIPVVMCTSNDDVPYQIEAREKGALGILPKPATPEKLSAMLGSIDAAMNQPADAAALPSAANAAVVAPAMDKAAITALVAGELKGFMENRVRPLFSDSLDQRLAEMQSAISERVLQSSAAQIEEWMDAEMARVREELSAQFRALDYDGLSSRMEAGLEKTKAELIEMEAGRTQTIGQKISDELLPGLIQKQIDQSEAQLYKKLDLRLAELGDRLAVGIPDNPQLIRKISDLAETAAEHKAAEVATSHAREFLNNSAEDKASELTTLVGDSTASTKRLIYVVGAVAAGIGILSSLVVLFLAP